MKRESEKQMAEHVGHTLHGYAEHVLTVLRTTDIDEVRLAGDAASFIKALQATANAADIPVGAKLVGLCNFFCAYVMSVADDLEAETVFQQAVDHRLRKGGQSAHDH